MNIVIFLWKEERNAVFKEQKEFNKAILKRGLR